MKQLIHSPAKTPCWAEIRSHKESNGQYPLLGRNVGNINFDRGKREHEKLWVPFSMPSKALEWSRYAHSLSPSIQINIHEVDS